MFGNIFRFLSQNQDKIILIIGAILIAAIGFAAGRLTAFNPQPEPIVIEEPEQSLQHVQEEGNVLGSKVESKESIEKEIKTDEEESEKTDLEKGKYVGSKSGKKYHYPDCRYGKKIKEENRIEFSSAKEAQEAGYEPCKVCKPPTSD